MSCKRCDLCGRFVVTWPGIFTVIGQLDLCGNCYWRYRHIVESLTAYFNQFGRFPFSSQSMETNPTEANHE